MTKLLHIRSDHVIITCAICDTPTNMSHESFIDMVNDNQESDESTGLFVVCDVCNTKGPEQWAKEYKPYPPYLS